MTQTSTPVLEEHDVESIDRSTRLRALGGSAIGSAVEWYDYFLYGTMASVVFGPLFFPSDNPMISTMLSLASFALAFLVRPIGGIIFSHIGDRIGRKKTLVMTLSLMGVSTAAMGLLPTHAQVGAAAGCDAKVRRDLVDAIAEPEAAEATE